MSSISGSFTSMSKSNLSRSITDLPNIPGIRRNPTPIVRKARDEVNQRISTAAGPSRGSMLEDRYFDDDDNSLMSYFDKSSKLNEMSKSVSALPSNAQSFNDLSGRYSLKSQQQDRLSKSRSLPFCSTDSVPDFVVAPKERVCRFYAFFTEKVPENLSEKVRSRKVEILFYPEDETLEIRESREHNSGLLQGKVLKRHQVTKPRVRGSQAITIFTLRDFTAGNVLEIYNRKYTVMDCDGSTKAYLDDIGQGFGESVPLPSTYYDPRLSRTSTSQLSRLSTASSTRDPSHDVNDQQAHKMTGFHKFGRKILRFYGIWDSRDDLFGDELKVRLHYMLADDTIEVLPVNEKNTGRDRMPKLLKKSKVLMPTGSASDFMSQMSRPTSTISSEELESLAQSRPSSPIRPTRHYHWTDLHIGDLIPVAAMHIKLVDVDDFTREFYRSKKLTLDPPIQIPQPEYPKFEVTIPPHTGFGSEIDSLTSCKGSLIPTAPHKDGAKLKLFQGCVLRFIAKLDNPEPADRTRSFMIQVFLEDDTIAVVEPPQRNSGHKGGVYLSRCKVEPRDGSAGVEVEDLYIGALVNIFSHKFNVLDADEYTLRFMEERADKWVHSALSTIVGKVMLKSEVLSRLILTTPGLAAKFVDCDELVDLLQRAGMSVVKQEAVTLFRTLDPMKTLSFKLSKLLKFILDNKKI